MTFFQDFPVPPPPPRGRAVRYVPPPWAGALLYELPVVLHIGQFLRRSPTMVMAVKSADVYSPGCSFDVSWTLRREEQSDEEWVELSDVFFRPGPGPRRGSGADSVLLFGVQSRTVQKPAPVPMARTGTSKAPSSPIPRSSSLEAVVATAPRKS
jgi:hypothetical protein